jgi:hypothetical protein
VQSARFSALFGCLWRALVGLVLCLSGCGFHSDIEALDRLRSQIRKHLGCASQVTVRTYDGKTTVTVRLDHFPARDSEKVQGEVEALAKTEFPSTNYVVVGRQ